MIIAAYLLVIRSRLPDELAEHVEVESVTIPQFFDVWMVNDVETHNSHGLKFPPDDTIVHPDHEPCHAHDCMGIPVMIDSDADSSAQRDCMAAAAIVIHDVLSPRSFLLIGIVYHLCPEKNFPSNRVGQTIQTRQRDDEEIRQTIFLAPVGVHTFQLVRLILLAFIAKLNFIIVILLCSSRSRILRFSGFHCSLSLVLSVIKVQTMAPAALIDRYIDNPLNLLTGVDQVSSHR